MIHLLSVCAQVNENNVCHILSVKGEVHKPGGMRLAAGDTILLKSVCSLEFNNASESVTLFTRGIGSFRRSKTDSCPVVSSETFTDFIAHLLKIKAREISLSSRGDCKCLAPAACFAADPSINDKILLTDTLSFDIENVLLEADNGFYFLQYRKEKKILKMNQGEVIITADDLRFTDTAYRLENCPELVLNMFRSISGKNTSTLVRKVKFNVVNQRELKEYYNALSVAMQGEPLDEIYRVFSNDVYQYYGKPTDCQLKKIIYLNQ
jgi:hypothetical protein